MLEGLIYGLMELAKLFLHGIIAGVLLYVVEYIPSKKIGLRTVATVLGIFVCFLLEF